MRSRSASVNVMFVRHTALFRNFTDIGSAMEKLKKKQKIVFGGNRPPPIFIFYDHTTIIAAEAHFIPYPKCVETLLSRAIQRPKMTVKITPDEGFPHLSNTVTIFLENSEKFHDDFRDV